ncbi:unnamed protein product [Lampetra planeri]
MDLVNRVRFLLRQTGIPLDVPKHAPLSVAGHAQACSYWACPGTSLGMPGHHPTGHFRKCLWACRGMRLQACSGMPQLGVPQACPHWVCPGMSPLGVPRHTRLPEAWHWVCLGMPH